MRKPVQNLHLQPGLQLTSQTKIPQTLARKTAEHFDDLSNLDPVKFCPPIEHEQTIPDMMHESHSTYNSVSRMNPFAEEQGTVRFGDFVDVDEEKTPRGSAPPVPPKLPSKAYKPPRVMHSRSEGNAVFRPGTASSSGGSQSSHIFSGSDENRSRLSEDTTSSSSLSRGRSLLRKTPSPTKNLEDIQEAQDPPSSPSSPKKRSRSPMKKLFGENGWLGKSMSMNELPSEQSRNSPLRNLGGKIKKRVGNITENVSKTIPKGLDITRSRSRSRGMSTFPVTLSPPMQAKLYSEIELMICATANQYLLDQVDRDRMSVESLEKVLTYWESKNRPQVIEFMFNQGTQRELIQANLKTFRFYGPSAANIVAMNSMMQSWKMLAKEMSVRTFCTPDSAVKKHLQDTYKILEMLGAPLVTFLAFQEISLKATKIMTEEQKRREAQKTVKFGVERQWQMPRRSADEEERLESDNPFT